MYVKAGIDDDGKHHKGIRYSPQPAMLPHLLSKDEPNPPTISEYQELQTDAAAEANIIYQ
jgi:hypothetical protein